MGCGSGILALAIAKLWHINTAGIDIDQVSVTVARDNARKNRLHTLTQFVAGDGYNSALARQHAPYDLMSAHTGAAFW